MVSNLKDMCDALRAAPHPQPNAIEQSLYMLILLHISSDIFLFHREKYALLAGPPEHNLHLIVKELRDTASVSAASLSGDGAEEDLLDPEYPCDAYDGMYKRWNHVAEFMCLVEQLRQPTTDLFGTEMQIPAEFQALHSTEMETGMQISTDFQALHSTEMEMLSGELGATKVEEYIYFMDAETREETLAYILRGLAQRRRCRSYAPPTEEEMGWYCQIRKWVTSAIVFLRVMSSFRLCEAARMLQLNNLVDSEEEMVNISANSEEYSLLEFYLSDDKFLTPTGHKTALVFDELPEIRSLLGDCKRRLSDITLRFSEKKAPIINLSHSVRMKAAGHKRKREQVLREQEVKKKRKHDISEVKKKRKHDISDVYAAEVTVGSCKLAEGNLLKTRCDYLVDILCAFEWMKNTSFSQNFSTTEVRLYAYILEHVNMSIWLFHERASPKEKLQHGVYRDTMYKKCEGSSVPCVNAAPERMRRDTREQYLEAVLSLVHKIEQEFSFSPPNVEEMIRYDKIRGHMDRNLLEPRCYGKRHYEGSTSSIGGTGELDDLDLAKRVQIATWRKEIEIADVLESEFEDMIRVVFPTVAQGVKATEWLENNTDVAKDLLIGRAMGCKVLGDLLLCLNEVDTLFGHMILRFSRANKDVCYVMDKEKRCEVPLVEGWVSLKVADASNSVCLPN